MSVTIHTARTEGGLFVTNENAAARRQDAKVNEKGRSTIFAGDMGVRQDSIMLKKQQVQKRAMKMIGDVFAADRKFDQGLGEMQDRMEQLKAEKLEYGRELDRIRDAREELAASCGVEEGSQEQADLELLRKERDLAWDESLTEEEQQRLDEIRGDGITDYQARMLELDEQEKQYSGNVAGNDAQIKGISEALSDMKLERLKSDPMLETSKEAEKMVTVARKEFVFDLFNEAKDHIEEKLEEEKKKAEERAEKKEEEEEKIEKAKEERIGDEAGKSSHADSLDAADVENMNAYNDPKTKIDKEIEEMLEKLKLIQDDLKGAAVDQNI